MTQTADTGLERLAPSVAETPIIAGPTAVLPNPCLPRVTASILVLTDVLAVLGAIATGYWLADFMAPLMPVHQQGRLFWAALLFPLAFASAGLYKGPSLAEEMRVVFYRTTAIWIGVMALTFLIREAEDVSRTVVCLGWGLTLFLVPFARVLVRTLFAPRRWWGSSVLVLGTEEAATRVVRSLREYPSRGVKPVGVLLCDAMHPVSSIGGVPVVGSCDDVERYPTRWRVDRAIVALSGLERPHQTSLVEKARVFKQLTVIPDFDFCSMWVATRDYGGQLGLHVKPELFRPWARFCKRFWDIAFASALLLALAPLFMAIALAVKLSSPGPVFYSHMRLGRHGKFFRMWKFRSMVQDADARLEEYLDANPEAKATWESEQKLQHDPRITWVGYLLRRTSLDELPQMWNVLNGTMSLVGPRPVPDDGIERFESYGALYVDYYKAVRPGLSGLWQVSGRSDLSYDDRVKLDMRYIRNWSVWFDWEILLKTVRAVVTGRGAW